MVSLLDLWLPILLSAVLVFLASYILHMVLPLHHDDYGKLPGEEKVRAAMRAEGVGVGNYAFPCPSGPKDMQSPEMLKKYKGGPVGFMTVLPSGPPAMGTPRPDQANKMNQKMSLTSLIAKAMPIRPIRIVTILP